MAYATQYNNYYEFGSSKDDAAKHAQKLTIKPWSVEVAGEAGKTGTFDLDDFLKGSVEEDRIYRLRCVEAWSMVIPWRGVPLGEVLKKFEPTSKAKFVKFTTLVRPKEMPGQDSFFSTIDYPYVEGLRIDEAMNDLALLGTGMYGKPLTQTKRCAVASCCALEVWLQKYKGDCEDRVHREAAHQYLERFAVG